MGSGKTTLGKQIASRLGCSFLDTDLEIEKSLGLSISQIFAEQGESHFRELEKNYIEHITADRQVVVSVGGGLPCFNNMMDALLSKGIVVYLKTSEFTLFNRLVNDLNERPLLEGLGEHEIKLFISDKLAQREKYYSQAHLIVPEQDQTVDMITQLILPLQKN